MEMRLTPPDRSTERKSRVSVPGLHSQEHSAPGAKAKHRCACSSTLAAAPFSAGIGQYYRQVTERHMDKHREPFRIFSSHGHGMAQREVQQAVVNPEELTRLGDGCLLYGKNHPIPILIQHFTL